RKFGQTKYGAARFFRGFSDFVTVQFLHKYSFRPLHFFGGIGAFLTFIGMVVSAYLTVLWFMGESIGKRPLLLLGVLLIVVGFQFVSLGLLGEMTLRFSNRKPFDISETTDSGHSTK
nr:glycosyltransferase [FCB group bacterium]